MNYKLFILGLLLLAYLPGQAQKKNNHKWNFDTLDGWVYGHQDKNPNNQCVITDGILKIHTSPNSRDRKKIRTADKIYTSGKYRWKTYIPKMEEKAQSSVGSWIYCDDHHELDFEVGYGKSDVRKQLNASPNDMIAYMTSQDHPYKSTPVKIKPGWHIFEIDLKLVDGHYYATWMIDGRKYQEQQLLFGNEIKFHIFCSVENLTFIGDLIPQQENYGLYDYVKYKFHK